jgi:hypothetical protein
MASVFSTPIEPNSAPTSLIAVGRELEDGAGEQVRRGFSFSAAADWADTEPYHDGTSRSFVVDFVSLQENRSPIADLNHKGHEDHEGGCRSPPVDRFPLRAVHSSPSFVALLVLHSRRLGLVGRGLRGSDLRAMAAQRIFAPWQRRDSWGFGDGRLVSTSGRLHNGDRIASLRAGTRSSCVAHHSVR